MRIYLAGPLFSDAERAWLDDLASLLRRERFECFVPHEQFVGAEAATPEQVFRVDAEGVRSSNVMVAWLDGPSVDDGTACEIGLFTQLISAGDPFYRGIVGIVTDIRVQRRRGNAVADGMNLFLVGAIRTAGTDCRSIEEAIEAVKRLAIDAPRPSTS